MSKFNELAYDRHILCSTIKNKSLDDILIQAQRILNESPNTSANVIDTYKEVNENE